MFFASTTAVLVGSCSLRVKMVAQCNVAWRSLYLRKKENQKLNPSQSALDFLFRFFLKQSPKMAYRTEMNPNHFC